MTDEPVTIKRKPRLDDLVVSTSGIIWVVEEIRTQHAMSNRVAWYGVHRLDNPGIPNAFHPGEVRVVAAADAARLRAATTTEPECDGCDQDPWRKPVHYGTCPLAPPKENT